ncbi:MAG: ABC-2 transporter permease [Candidatus Latescibacterota bacterium]
MRQWWTLLVKEAKDSQGSLLFLLGATLALGVYAHFRGISDGHPSGALGLLALPYATVFILPPVLLHSFAEEFKGQTHYQLLSLPVPRAAVVLSKYLVVVATGAAVFVLASAACYLAYIRVDVGEHVPAWSAWMTSAHIYFSALLLLTGIATAMAGLKLVVRRFQKLAMVAFFLVSFYIYGWVLTNVYAALGPFWPEAGAGLHGTMVLGWVSAMVVKMAIWGALVTIGYSLLLVALGILLFDRFAEA